jgi:hypothetical protein
MSRRCLAPLLAQILFLLASTGTYLAVETELPTPDHATLGGAFPLLDRPLRELTAADSVAERRRAGKLSTALWYAEVAYPAVDAVATPLIRGGDYESSYELTLMNLESFSAVSLLLRIPHKLLGRKRPLTESCAADPSYDPKCRTNARFQSFYGGHLAVSMTGAGLTCAHHLNGELYGGGFPEIGACSAAVGVALGVSYLRMRADQHWFTDQLLGAAVGWSTGFVLPTLLYYQPWRRHEHPAVAATHGVRWSVLPVVMPGSVSALLTVAG